MVPRKTAIAALLAVLLATAGCLSAVSAAPTADSSGADATTRTIQVSGTGEVLAAPDLATVRVSVVATADDADTARQLVADDAERMRAALRDAGVPDDAVSTAYYSLGPDYRYARDQPPSGYRAVHAYVVETTPDRAGEILDVAVSNGADQVDGVQFTLSDDARAQYRAEAISKAVASARADADAIASAAGVRVGQLRTASTSSPVVYPYDVKYAAESGGATSPSTAIEPGQVHVTASVSLAYDVA